MKVLFLDIDGVINVPAAELGWRYVLGHDFRAMSSKGKAEESILKHYATTFCVASLYNLHRIVEETGCKIVISSTWRYGADIKEMQSWFPEGSIIADAIIGKTPSFSSTSHPELVTHREYTNWKGEKSTISSVERGQEINHYVKENNIQTFAVVDDDSDMIHVKDHFFETDAYVGLNWHVADKVIEHLGKKNESNE